jgi:hypothetical protein
MSAFGEIPDMREQPAAMTSDANDPKRTSAGLKSRSAAASLLPATIDG